MADTPRRRRRAGLFGGEQSADPVPGDVDPAVRVDSDRPRPLPAQVHARQDSLPVRVDHRRPHMDVLRAAVHHREVTLYP